MLDRLQTRRLPPPRLTRQDIPLLGVGLELGAATRGTLHGPGRRCGPPGLVRACSASSATGCSDRGTLHAAAALPVAMAAAAGGALPPPAARSPAGPRRCTTGAYRDGAASRACRSSSAATIRSRWARSAASRGAAPRRGQELAVLWLDAHADYNTPETSPSGQPARHGAGVPRRRADAARRSSATRPLRPGAGRRTSTSSARARSTRGERARHPGATGIDCVDMRQIDERGVCALLAERIAGWRARGVHLHVSFDVDFLDPGGGAGHRHGGAGRRDLPRGASRHGDALPTAGSSARSTWSSSTPSSTSAAAPPWW